MTKILALLTLFAASVGFAQEVDERLSVFSLPHRTRLYPKDPLALQVNAYALSIPMSDCYFKHPLLDKVLVIEPTRALVVKRTEFPTERPDGEKVNWITVHLEPVYVGGIERPLDFKIECVADVSGRRNQISRLRQLFELSFPAPMIIEQGR